MMMPQGQEQETSPLSRDEVLEELAELGLQTSLLQNFSGNELGGLLTGLKRLIEAQSQNVRNSRLKKTEIVVPSLSAVDKKILKALLASRGSISSLKLSSELNIPLSTVQRRRKRLEGAFLETSYSLKLEKFGWRTATLYVSTQNGMTSAIGKELLSWQKSVTAVYRTMGENTVDLKLDTTFRDNAELLDRIEMIKSLNGVKNVFWSESIELLGKNNNHFDLVVDGI